MKKELITQGWLRVIIYIIGLLLVFIGANLFSIFVLEPWLSGEEYLLPASYVITSVFTILYTWLMIYFIDGKNFIDLGFHWKEYSKDGFIGLFSSVAMLGIGMLVLLITGFVVITGFSFDLIPFTLNLLLMLMVAVTEEVSFRGYILQNLLSSFNKSIALIISAFIFALFHMSNPGASILPIVNVFLGGLLLGANYIYTKNLWFGIMLHFGWNFLQGPVLGFEVSGLDLSGILQPFITGPDFWTGGSFGFEGSILCTILMIIFSALWITLFAKKYPQ